jgi:hypothetical protein
MLIDVFVECLGSVINESQGSLTILLTLLDNYNDVIQVICESDEQHQVRAIVYL